MLGRDVPRRILAALLLAMTLGLTAAVPAAGHAFAPSLLELREDRPGHVWVRFKQPAIRTQGSELRPVLPADCRALGEPEATTEGTGIVASWEIACDTPLVGQTIGIEGMAKSKTDALLRLVLADGRTIRQVLDAKRPTFVVPERVGPLAVARGYLGLGVEHILAGFDHLLFVFALLLIVGGGSRLVWTVTAFTVGHSITLALAVLGIVHLPQQPIEALIAFSIYVLAVELARGDDAPPSWIERRPWLVAGSFGLLHGLGFAGALSEIGLPKGEIPLALVSFNLGIEAGQLTFVGVVLLLAILARRMSVRWPKRLAHLPAYGIGTLAAFWFFERVASSL